MNAPYTATDFKKCCGSLLSEEICLILSTELTKPQCASGTSHEAVITFSYFTGIDLSRHPIRPGEVCGLPKP